MQDKINSGCKNTSIRYSPVNLTFDLKQIAFDCFIVLSCKVYLGECPRENLPKSRVWNMVKFKFEIKHFFNSTIQSVAAYFIVLLEQQEGNYNFVQPEHNKTD